MVGQLIDGGRTVAVSGSQCTQEHGSKHGVAQVMRIGISHISGQPIYSIFFLNFLEFGNHGIKGLVP